MKRYPELINQAVTKGLDPDVKMKPSGVEWIGEIPVHWSLCIQIDELIAAEQRKIELLKEYRQSLISEAVTGKIDVRNEV